MAYSSDLKTLRRRRPKPGPHKESYEYALAYTVARACDRWLAARNAPNDFTWLNRQRAEQRGSVIRDEEEAE